MAQQQATRAPGRRAQHFRRQWVVLGLALSWLLSVWSDATALATPEPPPSLTVLPLLGMGAALPQAPNLTGILFTELRRYEGFELRVRKPAEPLTMACITTLPCLVGVGQALETNRLLVGILSPRNDTFSLTLLAVDVSGQKILRGLTLAMTGDPAKDAVLVRPGVEQLALALGARLKVMEPPPSAPVAKEPAKATSPTPVAKEPAKAATSTPVAKEPAKASTPTATPVAKEPTRATTPTPVVLERQSLETLIAAAPARPESEREAEKIRDPEPPRTDPRKEPVPTTLSGEDANKLKKDQELRAKELEKQALAETREREKARREEEKRREQALKLQEAELERQRRADLKAAEARAKLEAEWQKAVQARREENIVRRSKGLPILPEPPRPEALVAANAARERTGGNARAQASNPTAANAKTGGVQTTAETKASASGQGADGASASNRRPGKAGSSKAETGAGSGAGSGRAAASNPRQVSEAEVEAVVGGPRAPVDTFLEAEGQWQVGVSGGASALVGYTLVDTSLELSFAPLPWLWVEGAVGSLHGFDPVLLQWFYLFGGRMGAVVRGGQGQLHPFGGLDLVGLVYGPDAVALGAQARGGLDIMLLDELGLRFELGLGAISSPALTVEPYGYPAATQGLIQFAVGARYRF